MAIHKEVLFSPSAIRAKNTDSLPELTKLNELAEQLAAKEPDECLRHTDEIVRVGVENYCWKEVARAYNTMGTAYWYKSDYFNCIASHQQALKIWESLSETEGIGTSMIGVGNAYLRQGDFQAALEQLQDALRLFQGTEYTDGIASVYNNIGVIYKNWGDYETAAIHYQKSLDIKEKSGASAGNISNSYNNIGLLYYFQENYSKALKYIQTAERINKESANKNLLADNYNNIGLIHSKEKRYDEALKYLFDSLEIKKELGDKRGMTVSYREIGGVNKQKGNYEVALKHYEEGLLISEEIQARDSIGFFGNKIGEVLLLTGKFDEAISYLDSALTINLDTGNKAFIKESYLFLSKIHAAKNSHEKAYDYLCDYVRVKDELFNEERTKTISEIQTKYEAEKKDLEIEKLNMEQQHLIDINNELELFAGKAAHDLKEPLRMMSSYSGLLEMRYSEALDEDGVDYLNIIQSASKRMTALLTGLLEYARSGASNVKKEDIDLNDILAHVKHNLQLTLKENEAKIVHKELPTVFATPSGMLQIFQNIIANAIKFRKTDTNPVITITCQKREKDYHLSIADNGIGIPDDQQAQVFEIFRRLNSRKHYSGSGIGLATCKKIIEGLKGNIWLESTHNVGTTFHFTIPFTV